MMKKISMMAFVLVAAIFMASSALALTAEDIRVKMDGISLDESEENPVNFEKGDELEVEVSFVLEGDDNTTQEYFEDIQVEARIRGYDQRDLIEDISDTFNVYEGERAYKRLNLNLPVRMEDGLYKVRVTISDAFSEEVSMTYDVRSKSENHGIWIKDVVLNPSNEVLAGRALLSTVRLENVGDDTEDDGVRVKVSMPELGISAIDYIDEIEAGESISSEELYMRIPKCTEKGTYDVEVEVVYRDGDEVEREYTSIDVAEGELCEVSPETNEPVKPTVTAGVDVQNVVAGEGGAIYPITISNPGDVAKTFTLSPDAEAWANVRVSPSNVLVVQPGQTQTAYVYVSAKEDANAGQNIFAVTVKSGNDFVEQFTFTANVAEGEEVEEGTTWDSVKRTLEIGLVVLVIILIILGLIIGLKRMKKDDDEGDEAQTYY